MHRDNLLARVFRAITGQTQQEFSDKVGITKGILTQIEGGKLKPSPDLLDRMAETAGLTVEYGDEILLLHDTLSRPRQRAGSDPEALFTQLGEPLRTRADRAFQRLLRLPQTPPGPEDRRQAQELFDSLKELTQEQRLAVVRFANEYQSPALQELAMEASKGEEGDDWAALAAEIAKCVGG